MTADHSVPALTTSRLLLRPLELADAPAVQATFPQWEIVRYSSDRVPWPYLADGATRFIRDLALPAMRRGEAWHWSIRLKAAPETLIGQINVMDTSGDNRGFWLDPAWQGQGLMSEAVEVVTEFWFETLGRPVLRAPKAAANVRSRRVSQRGGMRLVETVERDYVSGRQAAEVWELTREEWRQREN